VASAAHLETARSSLEEQLQKLKVDQLKPNRASLTSSLRP
jgi:hypothetical protein